jgi:PAS domain S-box-containing protein
MKRDRIPQLWRPAAQFLFGGISLVLLTYVGFRLGADVDSAAFAYLIAIVLLSLLGSLTASVLLSLAAAACLDFFFAPPLFSFHVGSQDEVLAIAGFLTASIIVTGLTVKVRKMAQEARASQKGLIETIPGLVWSALPDGSRDFHSRRWLEFTGLSAEDAAGDGWTAVLHPADRAAVVDKWRSTVATGESFDVEARERCASGEYRSMLVRAAPFRDDRGAIVKWYGSSLDIEDRRRAEQALRASERQWREVFEHNPVMYFMVDADGTVLSVNVFGAAQLGYRVSELVEQSVLNIFFEEDRKFVRRNIAVCLDNLGQSNAWEVRKVRKDGTVIWVRENAKAVRHADGRLIVLVACENITERRQTEDALRHSQMYLAEAQRIAHTGSFGWRVDTGDMIWSEETFRIFECDRTMKPNLELVVQRTHPEDRALVRGSLERASHADKDWEYERRLLMADGSIKHVRTVAHAVTDASGNREFVGAVMDITTIRRAEEQLQQARAELARVARVTTLGELTAAIAHEVNQPLTGLVSSGNACLRWLTGETPNLEAARRAVERMINDGIRAGEVISRIRAMVRDAPSRKDRMNINDTIREGIALIGGEIQRSGISLKTELSNDLALVLGDRVQLQQVIINLIMNAIEAMSKMSQARRELVIASVKDGSNGVHVAVQDSGPGLDPKALDHLFDAFYTTKPEGMGMGLPISRTIIEAHGGQLWATPNKTQGATFQFKLPTEYASDALS